jgi:hypothetical protein
MLDRRSCSNFFGSSPLMKVRRCAEVDGDDPIATGFAGVNFATPQELTAAPRAAKPDRVSRERPGLILRKLSLYLHF